MGYKTKIDWADSTWSPVTGCLHGCEYCYARGISKRFGGEGDGDIHDLTEPFFNENNRKVPYPYGFDPTLYRYKLDAPKRWEKPRTIFVCSMADLFGDWVPDEWIEEVFAACEAAPQHIYLFLTKNPSRYIELAKAGKLPIKGNFWYGSSTPFKENEFFWHNNLNTFVSIEPILEPFTGLLDYGCDAVNRVGWIIVGAETGNRKDKVVPEKSWIMELKEAAAECGVPLFMKDSIRELMGDDFIQQFPWEV